jgi:tetratricopeptide (TPR) repeat protein
VQPNNETALLVSGAVRLKKGETEQALALFKKAQELNPKNPAPRTDIAAVYVMQKKYPEAIKEYEEILKLDPNRVEVLSSLAQVYMIQGNAKAAFDRVEQQLPRTKNQAPVYQLMGQLKLAAKDYSTAIQHLEKAIGLNPELLSAYYLIGNAYVAQQKFDTAIAQYQKLLTKQPKAIPPLMMLGVLYDFKKEPQKANEYYQKILDINQGFAPAANNLAWNYVQHGGNLDVALGLAQKAREANPNDPGIADTLGWIHYKKGTYATAIGLLKESNEKFKGTNPTVLYHLGVTYDKSGEEELARQALKKALTVSQTFPEAQEAKKLYADLGGK